MSLKQRRLLLPEMEGAMARWYARQRGTESQIAQYRRQAADLTTPLGGGARVLEVAPGPGYLAIEIARRGRFSVTGLDNSRTMVDIAREQAHRSGVTVDFEQGDAAAMPFDSESFDLIVCQAAFKNFRKPTSALNEMCRVLRVGGTALIQDMRKDASRRDIAEEVSRQQLNAVNGWIVRLVLGQLRRRAYTTAQFQRLAGESDFRAADIRADGIGLEVRLEKTATVTQEGAKR